MVANMGLESGASEARFVAYVENLAAVLGHADRVEPLKDYCTGLLLAGERKSVEPMAAILAPRAVQRSVQRLNEKRDLRPPSATAKRSWAIVSD